MSRILAYVLLAVSALMLYGVVRSDIALSSSSAIAAMIVTVLLPAGAGIALLRGGGPGAKRLSARREQLRKQTVEAEILRHAVAHGGRLTALDITTALAISNEQAKEALDELVRREVAELDVSDEGVLIYNFHDAKHLGAARDGKGLFGG